jgi:hypothetical protein
MGIEQQMAVDCGLLGASAATFAFSSQIFMPPSFFA